MYVPPSPVDEREPLLNVGSVAASQLPGESGNQRESAPRMAARPPHASPDGASPYQPAPAPHQPTSAPRTPPPPPVPFTPDPTAYWQEPGTPKLLSQVCLGSSVFLIVLGFGSFALLLPLFVGILGVFMSFTLLFNASEIISERIRKASAMSIVGIIVCVVGALQILFDSLLAGYECETDPQVGSIFH